MVEIFPFPFFLFWAIDVFYAVNILKEIFPNEEWLDLISPENWSIFSNVYLHGHTPSSFVKIHSSMDHFKQLS